MASNDWYFKDLQNATRSAGDSLCQVTFSMIEATYTLSGFVVGLTG